MNKIVKKLKSFVDLHGAAQTAAWLGYRDSRAVSMWITRNEIPKARVELVKQLLEQKGGMQ